MSWIFFIVILLWINSNIQIHKLIKNIRFSDGGELVVEFVFLNRIKNKKVIRIEKIHEPNSFLRFVKKDIEILTPPTFAKGFIISPQKFIVLRCIMSDHSVNNILLEDDNYKYDDFLKSLRYKYPKQI